MDTIITVYKRKNPARKGIPDVVVWSEEHGFHMSAESFVDGQVFWAEVQGVQGRQAVKFSKPEGTLLSLEEFDLLKSQRRKKQVSWTSIKAAVREFFGGPKPEDVSWKKAKKLAFSEREEDPAGEFPRLLSRGYRPPVALSVVPTGPMQAIVESFAGTPSGRGETVRRKKDQTVSCAPPEFPKMQAVWP